MTQFMVRNKVQAAPQGRSKLKWYGPGLLWMLSAVGTGSILFTPRVAAEYEYQLAWLLMLVVFFMWVMIREMARFSIVSGQTMLEGLFSLSGPKGWAVWFILVPQLLAAAVGIAGLSAIVGSALKEFLPGNGSLYAVLLVVLCTLFVAAGRYKMLEKYSRYMAIVLMAATVVAAVVVSPNVPAIAQGLMPSWPQEPDLYIILPWVGTILAGSMGIVWFGYWTATRGFGGGLESRERDDESEADTKEPAKETKDCSESERDQKIKDWISVMTGTATLGVVAGLLVIFSFMVLGSELLAPKDMMPKGSDVATDLTQLFSDIWGSAGEYLLLAAIIIALGGSVLANQDGWGRSFADMTLILTRDKRENNQSGPIVNSMAWFKKVTGLAMFERRHLKRFYVVLVTGILPIAIILIFSDPVAVMSASGIIAALHTPFIALTALYVNRTRLPKALRPGLFITVCMTIAGIFYLAFACLYLWNMATGSGGG
ncbi:Nramp family divalent metal transporter [Gayadomonas joobiniege]|uniref:Nramp family divalent metal transporter n=1 Tax=Gayadomonas joobiniege TaxID=1234606 RepID=UPI00037EEA90|nr:Nramp family divalent metal transporter [Gayadomonas joobiniege]